MTPHSILSSRFLLCSLLLCFGGAAFGQSKYQQKIVGNWQLMSIQKEGASHNLADKNYQWKFGADGQLRQQSAEGEKSYPYSFSKDTLLVPSEGRKAIIKKLSGSKMEMYMLDRSATASFTRVKTK